MPLDNSTASALIKKSEAGDYLELENLLREKRFLNEVIASPHIEADLKRSLVFHILKLDPLTWELNETGSSPKKTAIHLAVEEGDIKLAKLMKAFGAKLFYDNDEGISAAECSLPSSAAHSSIQSMLMFEIVLQVQAACALCIQAIAKMLADLQTLSLPDDIEEEGLPAYIQKLEIGKEKLISLDTSEAAQKLVALFFANNCFLSEEAKKNLLSFKIIYDDLYTELKRDDELIARLDFFKPCEALNDHPLINKRTWPLFLIDNLLRLDEWHQYVNQLIHKGFIQQKEKLQAINKANEKHLKLKRFLYLFQKSRYKQPNENTIIAWLCAPFIDTRAKEFYTWCHSKTNPHRKTAMRFDKELKACLKLPEEFEFYKMAIVGSLEMKEDQAIVIEENKKKCSPLISGLVHKNIKPFLELLESNPELLNVLHKAFFCESKDHGYLTDACKAWHQHLKQPEQKKRKLSMHFSTPEKAIDDQEKRVKFFAKQ